MVAITIATLPLCLRNVEIFRIPRGFAVLDLETYRINQNKKWDVPPVTIIGLGYGCTYIRLRSEGNERVGSSFLRKLLGDTLYHLAAWNIDFEGKWFLKHNTGYYLIELQPRKKFDDDLEEEKRSLL